MRFVGIFGKTKPGRDVEYGYMFCRLFHHLPFFPGFLLPLLIFAIIIGRRKPVFSRPRRAINMVA